MSKHITEEEKFVSWFEDAKANDGLIDIKFYVAEIQETDKEQFYREANFFNEQLDREDITPRIEVMI